MQVPAEFAQQRVVVVGDTMLDQALRSDRAYHHPSEGVLVVSTYSQEYFPGGAGNIAANVSSLGGTAVHLGVVGADEDAARLRSALDRLRVRSTLVVDHTRPTTRKLRVYQDGGPIVRVDTESAEPVGARIERLLMQYGLANLDEASALVLSDYRKGVVTALLARDLLARARSLAVPTIVDSKSTAVQHFAGCTVFKSNAHELEALIRRELSDDGARVAAARSVSRALSGATVIVTNGAQGITLVEPDGSHRHAAAAPGGAVESVVGAGDTVTACLALALAAGMEISDAVDLALCAAAEAAADVDTTAVRGSTNAR